ncbi:MAG TPA: response regulator [Candidatus Thermoplasmatota archaeon]|nr:response regulator [Candidatus Thermoplasmatota archaeon]
MTAPVSILVVDDDAAVRFVCRRVLLRAAGEGRVEVFEAKDGEEAVRMLAARGFDVVLADYRMGATTGIDVLVEALRRHPAAARLLMSGHADPGIVEAARERARIHDFVEKPMSTGGFDDMLRRAVLDRYVGGAA